MNHWFVKLLAVFILTFVFIRFGPGLSLNSVVSQKQTIFSASGTGKVTVVPDEAHISAGVTVNKSSVKEAQTEANTVINRVSVSVKGLGVAEKDIQTSNYSIYPQYDYQSGRNRVTGYTVSVNLTIVVRDLEKINSVIDSATANGANQVGGITLTVNEDKRKTLEKEARQKAVDEARIKAQELAELSGMTLGRVVDIQENSPQVPRPFVYDAVALKAEGVGGDTQIQAGSTDITSTITLYYETR